MLNVIYSPWLYNKIVAVEFIPLLKVVDRSGTFRMQRRMWYPPLVVAKNFAAVHNRNKMFSENTKIDIRLGWTQMF